MYASGEGPRTGPVQQHQHQQTMTEAIDLGKSGKWRGRALSHHQHQQQNQQQQQQGRRCTRCGAAFGRFYNTGASCPRCKHRVCRQCREVRNLRNPAGPDWLCSFCHKIQDLRSASAEWRRTTGRDNYLSALDILTYSIRRAWTINGPPARWSAARKSAEFRIYRSLPSRRSNYLEEENAKNLKKTPDSLSKLPRITTKLTKQNDAKKSSIPVFRSRNSKEFEDIRSPHESTKRSLIPQRYRSSTDDLRRSREDINIPSFIPKLLSPRNKEDKLKRQDSKDELRASAPAAKLQPPQQNPQEARPTPALRLFQRSSREEVLPSTECSSSFGVGAALPERDGEAEECASTGQEDLLQSAVSKMVNESSTEGEHREKGENLASLDETDRALRVPVSGGSCALGESKLSDKSEECVREIEGDNEVTCLTSDKEVDKHKLSELVLGKKVDEAPPVIKRKFSKEELSNDDTDEAPNRRCSSHLSPEASPLSTRSSKYSPRESESEPTPALPRKTTSERESSSASQRIRDAITRTRRESNSSAKYESSGSESVRFNESRLSSYADIARRVKLFGSGSIGPSTGSCDEVLQRDSATSAGEDDHEEWSRDPTRVGSISQNRVMLRRRRQFDAQGPRRRGRSHARTCCGPEDLQVVGCGALGAATGTRGEEEPGASALLDYRRLVFISSDSSSGREEDDADSSCSGSSYLNGQPLANQQPGGLEDCDWDYFESNSLKLPQLNALPRHHALTQLASADWSCCPARPFVARTSSSGCCQACGASRNAKVLPVPVPIPVPVPYPVPVPASLWTGEEFAGLERARAVAANSMISRNNARLEDSLPLSLRNCENSTDSTWFSWNPRFDSPNLLFSQDHIFSKEATPATNLIDQHHHQKKAEEKTEPEPERWKTDECEKEVVEKERTELTDVPKPTENEEHQQQQQRMFRHSQEQDSRSSSGRSSADSSDLEDSASHRFSRVLVVNDDSLTSDNDIEDNEDSDSARESRNKAVYKETDQEPVVLQRIRLLDEDNEFDSSKSGKLCQPEDNDEEQRCKKPKNRHWINSQDNQREIAGYAEIYHSGTQEHPENLILLKSIKSIDPDNNLVPEPKPFPRSVEKPVAPLINNEVNQENEEEEEEEEEGNGEGDEEEDEEEEEAEEFALEHSCGSEKDDSSNDSAVMPDSLEVSMQDLEDSIEGTGGGGGGGLLTCDISRALLATSSPFEEQEGDEEVVEEEEEAEKGLNLTGKVGIAAVVAGAVEAEKGHERLRPRSASPSGGSSESSASPSGSGSSSGELHEYVVVQPRRQEHEEVNVPDTAALMAKSRKKWQIPTSFDIKGMSCAHFMPPERRKDPSHGSLNPLLSAAADSAELRPEDEENANGCDRARDEEAEEEEEEEEEEDEKPEEPEAEALAGGTTTSTAAHDESGGGGGGGGSGSGSKSGRSVRGECKLAEQVGGGFEDSPSRYRAVERRTPTPREENLVEDDVSSPSPARRRDWIARDVGLGLGHLNINNNNNSFNGNASLNASQVNNKYKSLVMITQAAYQPVNVITSDTTTLLQPQLEQAGYFQLALDAGQELTRRNAGLGLSKKPLPCKRLFPNPEPEVDSGLSVGSASESDDVQSVKNACKQVTRSPSLPFSRDEESTMSSTAHSAPQEYSVFEAQKRGGPLILEEGLADDDSWVEEISHDEDEQSATTATEESSEDEAANNLGDREEELRGYHRQAIDFTLHTIVEESCEESEGEHTNASWRRRLASASASELDKYLFFGIGADATPNNSSRELDSLSESSSIFSEGLDSLAREDSIPSASQEKNTTEYLNGSARLEKYFLGEFLGLEQDRRDSDGSVGSDSEGRPSPEAQRRKRLVRARGTGRSHSSSLDNLLALAHNSQNSLQDTNLATEGQESQSEGSSTETDGIEDNPTTTPAFGTDGQFDTVKRKKKKLRNLGAQSPRVTEDRNKTPEPRDMQEEELETVGNSEEEGTKIPHPEAENHQGAQEEANVARSKQQSRDSGFIGSCDDLLLQPPRGVACEAQTIVNGSTTNGEPVPGQDQHHRQKEANIQGRIFESQRLRERLTKMDVQLDQAAPNASLTRKDSFNNWSSDEETNLMMSKMRQFFKTMVANSNVPSQTSGAASSGPASAAPTPSPRLSGYSKTRSYAQAQNRTKPPQLVYFENELTRLMKTVPGIRDEQVREIVEYLSSEDTWSDSYDSSDYTSSDLEGATAGGRRSALQEQISQSCQQIINKFDTNATTGRENGAPASECREPPAKPGPQQACLGRDTAFVYQKLVQSFTKMAGDNVTSDASSTPHSSPPLIAKVMHHIGSRLVALMHEVSESNSTAAHSHSTAGWRRYPHHRTPSSASTTEDDDSTSDSASAPSHLPRSKSHDPLLLINGHAGATSMPPEAEEREASDYERFSWRGSFESALMAADSRTKLSLLACSGDVGTSAMAAKRRSAGDLLFNPKSFSREQLDRVRSCGSIGGNVGVGTGVTCGGSIEEKIWSNRRRSSVPDANTRGESGASAGDEDTEDEDEEELEYGAHGDSRATTLPRGMQVASGTSASATNSLPRQTGSSGNMHKAHSVYHFLPQHSAVKSARYRPPGFTRNSPTTLAGPKRAVSAPGLQFQQRPRRQQGMAHSQTNANVSGSNSASADEVSSLSEACSTPIIGASSRTGTSHASMDLNDIERSFQSAHLTTRASLSSLGARSDSMASVYSGAGEGRWCGSVAVRGEVEFSLQYDYKQLTFEVHVTQCKDLAPVDVKRNRSDPYVKVYLLPDKSKSGKRKTKVKKHTLNPVFDETLKFHTSINSLESRTLWLTVWHSDMFGRNDFLGEVRMSLENKIFDDPRPQWYPLQERTEPFDDPVTYKGEVIVGLKFVPPDAMRQDRDRDTSEQRTNKLKKNWNKGALHVLVKEARNLQTRAKNSGTCDPFCKSYLLPDKGRSGKQKTGVVRRSAGSPVWNHTFVYKDVSLQELADRGLELTVWDHDRIASNEFLGGVRFNLGTGKHYGKAVDWMDATGREMSLWQNMLERPNFWVEGAVTLRPNLHNHGKNGTS